MLWYNYWNSAFCVCLTPLQLWSRYQMMPWLHWKASPEFVVSIRHDESHSLAFVSCFTDFLHHKDLFFFFSRGVLVLLSLLWHNYLHIRETLMHSYSFWKLVQGKKDLLHNFALQVLQTFFTHETQALQKQGKNSLDFRGGVKIPFAMNFRI